MTKTSALVIAFLIFVISLFLTLGSHVSSQVYLRMAYASVLFLTLCFVGRSSGLPPIKGVGSWTAWAFLGFFGFQITRLVWTLGQIIFKGLKPSPVLPLDLYLSSPLSWCFYLGLFTLGFFLFREKKETKRLLWVLSGSGFFLALNAIPPLLSRGNPGFLIERGKAVFFHPVFYFHEIVPKYFLGGFAHSNYTGDVIALGFFPALGLLCYVLLRLIDRRQSGQKSNPFPMATFILLFTMIAANGLAAVAFLSRGTILSFALAFFLFLLVALMKFFSKRQLLLVAGIFLIFMGFLVWAGTTPRVLKEIQSLKEVVDPDQHGSFFAIKETMRRALLIYQTNPLWGVGSGGYGMVSKLFATPGTEGMLTPGVVVMSFYFQLLAEEGLGAYLYFLFLLTFFLEVFYGLGEARSRFQFMAALSLFAGVCTVLAHASINPLMHLFPIAALVHILMGATLGILGTERHCEAAIQRLLPPPKADPPPAEKQSKAEIASPHAKDIAGSQ